MKKLLLLPAILLGFVLFGGTANAGWVNIPGTACHPYSNDLADMLQRNHVRLQNPSNSGRSMWVLCPIQRDVDYVNSSTSTPYGYINLYRQPGGGFDDTYTDCYVRQLEYDTSASPGSSTSGQLFSVLVSTDPIPASKADSTYFSMPAGTHSDGSYDYYSVMCLLKPGIGINSVDVRLY